MALVPAFFNIYKKKVRDSTPDCKNENVFEGLCVLVPQLENNGFGAPKGLPYILIYTMTSFGI